MRPIRPDVVFRFLLGAAGALASSGALRGGEAEGDWADFRARHFGTAIGAEANPFADPDGDGATNLLEHALGTDPRQPGACGARLGFAPGNGGDGLVFSFSQAAVDVTYRVTTRSDLAQGAWSDAAPAFAASSIDARTGRASFFVPAAAAASGQFYRLEITMNDPVTFPRADGYRGIWFTLGQFSAYGDKYSGGLGTYTSSHAPMAIHAPEVNKTFFTYGGTRALGERHLLLMLGCYDHSTGEVTRPVIVHDKDGVDDPHDNASLSLDEEGHLWLFVSGRNTTRRGFIYRSRLPYGINDWERRFEGDFAYPQPWWIEGNGFLHLYTRYTNGRELYARGSADGRAWGAEKKLAGFGGHYLVSEAVGSRVIGAFNRHPGGNVDARTDLYFFETSDHGTTWRSVGGAALSLPLTNRDNPARVRDYAAEGLLVYLMDVTVDAAGRPIILYLTSTEYRPGPPGNLRTWRIAHWSGSAWIFRTITTSTHNYDTGSIQIDPDGTWRVTGPTEAGPQPLGTGGEIAMWTSVDKGATWTKARQLTGGSALNHTYARRPRGAHPDFHTYWADGDADKFSASRLYFTNRAGDQVWRLPYDMPGETAVPLPVTMPAP